MIDVEMWKKRKKSLKMTFENLSEISGIPKRTLEDIFAGRTSDPRHDTVQAIEKALGLSTSSMPASTKNTPPAGFENMPELLSEKRFVDIAKIYHELTDEYREKVLAVVTVIALGVGLNVEKILGTKK